MIQVYGKYLIRLQDSERNAESDSDNPFAQQNQQTHQYHDLLVDRGAETKAKAWRHAEMIDTKVKRSFLQSALGSVRHKEWFKREIGDFVKQIDKNSQRALRIPKGRLSGIKRKGLGALAGLLGR